MHIAASSFIQMKYAILVATLLVALTGGYTLRIVAAMSITIHLKTVT
ncbi:hypothetical protein BMS3Bbin04_00018 [bacterium BMS3Bbin04]|nr:hypothetical protein BMS3Bbin04_00018 [bacterium BMS3Bbin04]